MMSNDFSRKCIALTHIKTAARIKSEMCLSLLLSRIFLSNYETATYIVEEDEEVDEMIYVLQKDPV